MASFHSLGSLSSTGGNDQPMTATAGMSSTAVQRFLLSPTPAVAATTASSSSSCSTDSSSTKPAAITLYPISPVPSHLLCAICTMPYENPVHFLPCCHVFCHECIQLWISMTLDADDLQTELRLILDGTPSHSARARHGATASAAATSEGSTTTSLEQQHQREHNERQQTLFDMGQIDSYSRAQTGPSASSSSLLTAETLLGTNGSDHYGIMDDHTFFRDTVISSPSPSSDPYTQQIRWNAVLQTREMPKCPMCRTALHVQGWDRIEKRIPIPTPSAFGRRRRPPSSLLSPAPSSSPPSDGLSLQSAATAAWYSGESTTLSDHERGRTRTLGQRSGTRGGAPSRPRLGRTTPPQPLLLSRSQHQPRSRITGEEGGEDDDGAELEQVTRFHGRDPLSYQPSGGERTDTVEPTAGESGLLGMATIIGRRPSEWMRDQQQQIQAAAHQEQLERQNRRRQEQEEEEEEGRDAERGDYSADSTMHYDTSFRTQADTMAILDRHQQQIQRLYREQQEQEELLRMLATRAHSLTDRANEVHGASQDHTPDPEIREGQRQRLSMAQPRLQLDASNLRSDGQQQLQEQQQQQGNSIQVADSAEAAPDQETASRQDHDTQSDRESSRNEVGQDAINRGPRDSSSLDDIQQGSRARAEEEEDHSGLTMTLPPASSNGRPLSVQTNMAALATTTRETVATAAEVSENGQQAAAQRNRDRYQSPGTSQSSPVESVSDESNLSMHSDSSLVLESSQASAGPDSSTRPPSMMTVTGSRFSFTSSRSGYRRDRESQSTIQSHGLQMPTPEFPLDLSGGEDGGAVDAQNPEQMEDHGDDDDRLDRSSNGAEDLSSVDEMTPLNFESEVALTSSSPEGGDGAIACGSSAIAQGPSTLEDNSCTVADPQDGDRTLDNSELLDVPRRTTEPTLVINTVTMIAHNSNAGPTPVTSTVHELQVQDTTTSVRSAAGPSSGTGAVNSQCLRSPAASPLPTPRATTPARARFPAGVVLDSEEAGVDSDTEVDGQQQQQQHQQLPPGQRSLRSELELQGFSPSDAFSTDDGSSSSAHLEPRQPRMESVVSVRTWMEEEEREIRECIPALSLSSPLLRTAPMTFHSTTTTTTTSSSSSSSTSSSISSEPDIPEPGFFSSSSSSSTFTATSGTIPQRQESTIENTPLPLDVTEEANVNNSAATTTATADTTTTPGQSELILNVGEPASQESPEEVPSEEPTAPVQDNSVTTTSSDEQVGIPSEALQASQSTTAAETAHEPAALAAAAAASAAPTNPPSARSPPSSARDRVLTTISPSAPFSRHTSTQLVAPRITHQLTPITSRNGRTALTSSSSSSSSITTSSHSSTATPTPTPAPPAPSFRIHVRFQPTLPKAHVISDLISQIPVECPQRRHGCPETMPLQGAGPHLRDQCRFRIVTCPRPRCGLQMRADLLLDHVLKAEASVVMVVGSPVFTSAAGAGKGAETLSLSSPPHPQPPTAATAVPASMNNSTLSSQETKSGGSSIPACPGLTWEREQLARATAIIAQLTEENSGLRNSMRQMDQQNAKLLKEKERWKRYENLRFK